MSASAVNVARSVLSNALPQVNGVDVGQCPICRFLKGVNKLRPQKSRYLSTWDTDVVLEYLQQCYHLSILTFRELTEKLVMLFLLCSSQRVQTLSILKLDDILFAENGKLVVFRLSEPLKQFRKGAMGQ